VDVVYSLKENHAFEVAVRVENTGNSPMPFGDGWHPYFRFGKKVDELFLKIPSTE
jgi:aldose 1-epimerase